MASVSSVSSSVSSAASSVVAKSVSSASASSDPERWESYHDESLGIRIEYPVSLYAAEAMPAGTITFGTISIPIDAGFRFSDGHPEGDSVRLYRTSDARILDYLKQDHPLQQSIRPDGTAFMRFDLAGMAQVYGYVTKRGAWYYVFESRWGPTNPVSERMLGSMTFDQ